MKSQLRSGIILSYINLGISAIIPFVYTPVMLELLGQSEYGLYSLANSVVGYLSLLNLGFGSTVIRYIAKYRAEKKVEDIENVFGFFIMVYGVLAVFVLVGGVILSENIDVIFKQGLTVAEIAKTKILVLILSINVAISFPISVFSSVAIAFEKYLFRKTMDIISTTVAPIMNLIALYLGFASIGMVCATTIIQCCLAPISVVYCVKVIKVKPRFVKMPLKLVGEMLGFSMFVFIGTIVDMLFWATDKVILGMLVNSAAVAIYNVGGTFNNIVMNVSQSISSVFTPRITGMVATSNDKRELSSLMIRIGRIQFLIIALIISGFAVFGQVFIVLWAGPKYLSAYWITVLTMFPMCIPLIQNIALSIVVAKNKHQFRAIVYLIIAICNVISTYLVVPYMGSVGAALCSCISYLLGQGLIMNIYYYKVIGLDIPLFWCNILKMAIIPAMMLAGGLLINQVVVIDRWSTFLMGTLIYTMIYVVLMYCVVMTDYEKDIVRKPLKKIICKIYRY